MHDFETIFACVRRIPPGHVLSYGEVGRAAGVTARTVGWAMSDCPDDVPWHRVVGADGYLRIARRSALHFEQQKALLEAEGITLNTKNCVPASFFWSHNSDEDNSYAQVAHGENSGEVS